MFFEKVRESYYAEFFWFPANGVETGYWENCWKNDGNAADAVELNDVCDDAYQTNSLFLADFATDVLVPVMLVIDGWDGDKA